MSYEENKKWRKENPEKFREQKARVNKRYRYRYPNRERFTQMVAYLVSRGYIKKQPCSICGSTNQLEACTFSENPYNPVYFCDGCHKKFHELVDRFGIVKHIG